MSAILRPVGRFLESEDGPTAVEYAVMLALVIIAAVTAISGLGTKLTSTFSSVTSNLQ